MQVFVSHSSANGQQAKEICQLIEKNGHSCFFAPRDIQSGHEYAEALVNGIDSSDIIPKRAFLKALPTGSLRR